MLALPTPRWPAVPRPTAPDRSPAPQPLPCWYVGPENSPDTHRSASSLGTRAQDCRYGRASRATRGIPITWTFTKSAFRRPPLLAGHRAPRRYRRQAALLAAACRRAGTDACGHFVSLLREILEPSFQRDESAPAPVLTAPFDAELFGHWWFEGPQWLEAVCRLLHESPSAAILSPSP